MGETVSTRDVYLDGRLVGTMEVPVEEDNRQAIIAAARTALATNRTYVGLASPSNAQTVAQVKALSRQVNGLIRVLLGDFSGTD